MKKLLLTALAAITGLVITGCSCSPRKKDGEGSGSITVYLDLGDIGLYKGKPGNDYPDVHLENAIKYKGDPGDALPGADVVTATSGATFVSWMCYEGEGAPKVYTTVPEENNKILIANFNGGGGGPTEQVTYTITGLPEWITNDGCVIFAWAWGGSDAGGGKWYSCTYGEGAKPTSLTFTLGAEADGCLLARCIGGTTLPDWNNHGDTAGRVYNQTENIDLTSGVYSYSCGEWKEYH